MALINDEAFIIKNKRFKESDKLITFFGRRLGKSQAIAKGAQKPEVRKTGNLESGSIVKFSLAEGSKLDIITEVEVLSAPGSARNLNKVLLYISELVDKYTIESDTDTYLFDVLNSSIQNLKKSKVPLFIANSLHLLLMQKAGLLPDLRHCAKTGVEIKAGTKAYLSETGPVVSDFPNPLPFWPLIKADYFLVLASHEEYQEKTSNEVERNLFKILNFIAEKTLEKQIISKNLFNHQVITSS